MFNGSSATANGYHVDVLIAVWFTGGSFEL